ncbi:MAG: T9SS type A sorting domain-containing protein, partial [Bacteroidales bacterium]
GVLAGLFLGKNNSSDNTFYGSFDQTSLWSRTLSYEEIMGLMHQAPKPEKDLICYISYNETNANGRLIDLIEGTPVQFTGRAQVVNQAQIPYSESSVTHLYNSGNVATKAHNLGITMPSSFTRPYAVTHVGDQPFQMTTKLSSAYRPIEGGYYAFAFDKAVNAGVNAAIRYTHRAIQQGDSVVLLTRELGEYGSFKVAGTQVAATNDSVIFTIADPKASQAIVFVKSASSDSIVSVELSADNNEIVLEREQNEIPLKISYLSGNISSDVILSVEEHYATIQKDTCLFDGRYEIENTILLDRSAMNKFGVNTITVNARGTDSKPLSLTAEFEPMVQIRLKNGDGTNKLLVTKPTLDLEIETELLQGILREPVRFATTSDVSSSVMTSLNQLLSENSYSEYELNYQEGAGKPKNKGFNLIGNPYMADINLTKSDNVSSVNLNRYFYTYDPYRMCYHAFDMRKYNEANQIQSMSAFFVQTTSADAMIEIHNKAKQKVLNKRNSTHFMLESVDEIGLSLFADGKPSDRIEIRLEADVSNEAVLNEDATKMFSFEDGANQLFTEQDEVFLSIDCREKGKTGQTKLGARFTTAQNIELQVTSLTTTKDMQGFYLVHTGTGEETLLTKEQRITVDKTSLQNGQYVVRYVYPTVSQDAVSEKSKYYVTTDGNQVVVHNLSGNERMMIYSLNGQVIRNEEVKSTKYSTRLDAGIYIIRVNQNGQEYSSKFIVK